MNCKFLQLSVYFVSRDIPLLKIRGYHDSHIPICLEERDFDRRWVIIDRTDNSEDRIGYRYRVSGLGSLIGIRVGNAETRSTNHNLTSRSLVERTQPSSSTRRVT